MSEELSPQVLARKQRFIEDKEAAGSFEALMDQQDVIHRSKRVFFDERGDIAIGPVNRIIVEVRIAAAKERRSFV